MRLDLLLIVLVLAHLDYAQSSDSTIERSIRRVEQGLLSSYGDPPWKRMDLADRMAHYNVPGVSIAVINNYQVEWTRGYGVLEAGRSEPVTPGSLFQPASIAKLVVAVTALRYVERGALDLDEEVNQGLVSWRVPENEFTAAERVTLRRIFSFLPGTGPLGAPTQRCSMVRDVRLLLFLKCSSSGKEATDSGLAIFDPLWRVVSRQWATSEGTSEQLLQWCTPADTV